MVRSERNVGDFDRKSQARDANEPSAEQVGQHITALASPRLGHVGIRRIASYRHVAVARSCGHQTLYQAMLAGDGAPTIQRTGRSCELPTGRLMLL